MSNMKNTLLNILFLSTMACSAQSFAWTDIHCAALGATDTPVQISEILIHIESLTQASLKLETENGAVPYSNVQCHKETTPENLFSCEHDDFIFIASLDEDPMPAALNPYVYQGKEYGPFYFNCKRNSEPFEITSQEAANTQAK
jgi:hypothetical protein